MQASQVPHQCDFSCLVVHEFGNLYTCRSSGMQHVCDQNCNQRVYNDRYRCASGSWALARARVKEQHQLMCHLTCHRTQALK